MKRFLGTLIAASILLACINNPKVPAGYKPCGSDPECPDGQICWFHGIDTYAVCINDPNWPSS